MAEAVNESVYPCRFWQYCKYGKDYRGGQPDSAPIKRMVQTARETGAAVDATQGRKTKAVLVMENGQLVLSALLPETIANRAQAEREDNDEA